MDLTDGYNIQPDVLSLAAKIGLLVSTENNHLTLEDIRMYVCFLGSSHKY